jgi:hypothetical protein
VMAWIILSRRMSFLCGRVTVGPSDGVDTTISTRSRESVVQLPFLSKSVLSKVSPARFAVRVTLLDGAEAVSRVVADVHQLSQPTPCQRLQTGRIFHLVATVESVDELL